VKHAALMIFVVLGVCVIVVLAIGAGDARVGLEHTIYLYHKLIDPPVSNLEHAPSPATYRLEMWRAEQALKAEK
jgi:hypothetical protein